MRAARAGVTPQTNREKSNPASVEHPEAPPCDLDGLEDVATLLRF
eukprot:COSAG02_NODE_17625_length_990_cov_3.191919_1_plen_45_part_00